MTVRMTTTTKMVLRIFLESAPDEEFTGYRILKIVDLGEGTLYPLLARLARAGWLTGRWDYKSKGPAKRFYKMTTKGREVGGGKWTWTPRSGQ